MASYSLAQSLETAPNVVKSVEMKVPKTLSRSQLSRRLRKLLSDREKLTVSQVTEAILKLIVQDISHLKVNLVSPMVIRGVIPQAPLAPSMSTWAESRLSSFIHQASSIELRECVSCKRQITSIDDQRLVFLYGNLNTKTSPSEKDESNFRSALDLSLSWSANEMNLIAHARLLSPQGKVLWHESYRSGDNGSFAKRGVGEQKNETSMAKYQSLAFIPPSQTLGIHEINVGLGFRSGQNNSAILARIGYGYGVFFGADDRQLLMLQALMSFNQHFFTDLNVEYRRRLNILPSISSPDSTKQSFKQRRQQASQGLWFKAMLGVPFSALIAGNSLGMGLHYMSAYRIGLAANLHYSFNFGQREGPNPGGFGADICAVINF